MDLGRGELGEKPQQTGHTLIWLWPETRPEQNALELQPGQSVTTSKFTAEIIAVDDIRMPKEVLFTFNEVLEDSELYFLWFNWHDGKYHKFETPEIDQSASVPAIPQIALADALRYIMKSF